MNALSSNVELAVLYGGTGKLFPEVRNQVLGMRIVRERAVTPYRSTTSKKK